MSPPAKNFPTAFTLIAYQEGRVPATLPIKLDSPVSENGSNFAYHEDLKMVLLPTGPTYSVVEVEPRVHHIGDSNFDPVAQNSQFQFPDAEAASFTRTFEVKAASLALSQVTMTFIAKGITCHNAIQINGLTPFLTTTPSAADGSYSTYSFPVPKSQLFVGTNTITVTSQDLNGTCNDGDADIDDFEFANILLKFT